MSPTVHTKTSNGTEFQLGQTYYFDPDDLVSRADGGIYQKPEKQSVVFSQTERMKEITFDAFYQLYQNDQLSLVDVREVDEFEALHLEGAQNLPLSQLADTYDQLDKDQLHYVICKSGMRSARACQFLSEQGYEVINVQGGMMAFEEL